MLFAAVIAPLRKEAAPAMEILAQRG